MNLEVDFPPSPFPAVNVSTIPQRSPLRYPGGKTWFIPHVRAWLSKVKPDVLLDPFAGGGIVPLTSVMEGLVKRCVMIELDRDVAAFWEDALHDTDAMIGRILQFNPTRENVVALERQETSGFRTLVLNRTRNFGILRPRASLIKNGENQKGIGSRWYPDTLIRRLQTIAKYADRITFYGADGMAALESLDRGRKTAVFIDPPYAAGGRRGNTNLYRHSDIDHRKLFRMLAESDVDFLMTNGHAPEIAGLVRKHGFHAVSVRMKNAHHDMTRELVITRNRAFQ